MRKKILAFTCVLLCAGALLSACGAKQNDSSTTVVSEQEETETIESEQKESEQEESESPETELAEESEEEETASEGESFVAQGKIALMAFLSNAGDNGYNIDNPSRDGNFVSADAIGSSGTYSIRYFVEDQKVYSVELMLTSLDDLQNEDYVNCFVALVKAINPDADESVVTDSINQIISNPENKVVNSEMLFRYDADNCAITVSY